MRDNVPAYNSIEERRSLCLVANKYACNVPLDKCEQCKAYGYIPMGLETMGGFEGIKNKQQGH